MGANRLHLVTTPYPHTAVGAIDYTQSADALYLMHLDYPVQRGTRSDHTSWEFVTVTFGPTIGDPVAAPGGTANKPNMTGYEATVYTYVYTQVGGRFEQESRPSPPVALTNDLTLHGNTNVITMPAKATGVDRYIIYKSQGGNVFGYIGSTEGTQFIDGNPQIQAVYSDTPPIGQNPFADNNYPSTGTFHDGRLMLGGTRSLPNAVWGSQPSDFENMDISRPAKPDDALSFALVAEKVNSVNQLVSMEDLLVFSTNGVFSVNGGGENTPMTPSSIVPKRQNSRGGSRLNPIVLDEIVFYTPAKGNSVRTLGFQFEIDGYQSNNVSIFSPHLFKGVTIKEWAYIEEPYSAIIALRSDGELLCFTWEAEQQVWGWTKWETNGKALTLATITEGGFDRLYVLFERVIGTDVRRFHERLALPHVNDISVACHLDCSVTQVYDPPRNVISGLSHLEGATVSAYYDGYTAHNLLVTDGEIELPNGYEASIATVGLPYSGEIETLPAVLNTRDGSMHLNQQNVAEIILRAVDTRGLKAGITGMELEPIEERTGGEVGLADVEQRDYEVPVRGHWDKALSITIRQDECTPAHLTGLFYEPRLGKK